MYEHLGLSEQNQEEATKIHLLSTALLFISSAHWRVLTLTETETRRYAINLPSAQVKTLKKYTRRDCIATGLIPQALPDALLKLKVVENFHIYGIYFQPRFYR